MIMSAIRKLIGVLLLIAAIIGLIFSIAGTMFLWRIEGQATTSVQSTIELLIQTLETTSQGLTVTQAAIKGSVQTIRSLQSTVETTALTIKSSTPMVAEITTLFETNLPDTIQATEQSLRTAQQSAQVIDTLLAAISSIPFIGSGIGYNPDVPLSDALGQVADSLTGLPESFANMEESLSQTSGKLETFQADLTVMAESIGEIENSVAQYDLVIVGYQQSLDQVQVGLKSIQDSLPNTMRMILLAMTVFLVWMAIAQLGLLTQGWELITENPKKKDEPEAAEPAEEK